MPAVLGSSLSIRTSEEDLAGPTLRPSCAPGRTPAATSAECSIGAVGAETLVSHRAGWSPANSASGAARAQGSLAPVVPTGCPLRYEHSRWGPARGPIGASSSGSPTPRVGSSGPILRLPPGAGALAAGPLPDPKQAMHPTPPPRLTPPRPPDRAPAGIALATARNLPPGRRHSTIVPAEHQLPGPPTLPTTTSRTDSTSRASALAPRSARQRHRRRPTEPRTTRSRDKLLQLAFRKLTGDSRPLPPAPRREGHGVVGR